MLVYVLCDFHVSQKISHPACPWENLMDQLEKIDCLLLPEQEFQLKNLVQNRSFRCQHQLLWTMVMMDW